MAENSTASQSSNEMELVEKVFLKIVFADTDDQFQSSLNSFLAPVLLKLASQTPGVRDKILELLTHINKRLKSRPKVALPLEALLRQYESSSTPAMVWNFSIIYIKMGYQRSLKEDQVRLVPRLFACLPGKMQQQQDVVLQLLLPHLADVPFGENPTDRALLFPCLQDKAVRKLVLDYALNFLYLPGNMDMNVDDINFVPPAGLSKVNFKRLLPDPLYTVDQLEKAKLGILKLLTADIFEEDEVITHLLVASSDAKHSIADLGENGVKKFSSSETWEKVDVVKKLLSIYQGSTVTPGNLNRGIPSDEIRMPASIRLKQKIFPVFLRSKCVGDVNPTVCIQIIFDGLFGEQSNAKLKKHSLEFCHHICQYGSEKTMDFVGPLFYQALCKIVMDSDEELRMRALALEGLSKLSRRVPVVFRRDVPLVAKLFKLLEKENSDIRVSLQETLSTVANAYSGLSQAGTVAMEKLVLEYVEQELPQARLAALLFAKAAFPQSHVISRYVCLLATGDRDDEVREEARRGLGAISSHEDQKTGVAGTFPEYTQLVNYVYDKWNERLVYAHDDRLPFSNTVIEKMLLYLRRCLRANAGIAKEHEVNESDLEPLTHFVNSLLSDEVSDVWLTSLGHHLHMIRTSLGPMTGQAVHVAAMLSLLELLAACPSRLCPLFLEDFDKMKTFLVSSIDNLQRFTAQALGILLCSLPEKILVERLRLCLEDCRKQEVDLVNGSLLLVSFTVARSVELASLSGRGIQLEIPEGEIDAMDTSSDAMPLILRDFVGTAYKLLFHQSASVVSTACQAVGEVGKSTNIFLCDQDGSAAKEIVQKLSSILSTSEDAQLQEESAVALGNISVWGGNDASFKGEVINALFEMGKVQRPELQFTIGEALACVAAGRFSSCVKHKWILPGQKRNVASGDSLVPNETLTYIVHSIIKNNVRSSKASQRQAGVIWLLCLVKYASMHPSFPKQLKNVQAAFVDNLSDLDEITQDVAARGLGLVYDRVEGADKDALVSILVDTLMTGKQVKMEVDDETELFKPGSLGVAPDGGNLSTYKELCSLASSLNRPDLMYKFMNLAHHNSIWNSRKGAAFGFLQVASLAGDQLQPYLDKIVPKLYRYQYDPNAGVQHAMSNIWSALVPAGKKAIDQYLDAILKDLLSNITNGLWRVRESCCLGLNDLIKTCSGEDIMPSLPEIWESVFRVLDDIKESVRTAALALAKTLSRLSIRLCDITQSKVGQAAVSELLPILLNIGLASRVDAVKAISLQTLVQISKSAGVLIKPHIHVFVISLLESLSGLEPQRLQELHLQLSEKQDLQDKVDSVRLSISKESPMMAAINFCVQYIDAEVLEKLVPKLSDLLRSGIGLGTRVGCCTLVISLTHQCRDELTPYTGKVLSALLNGLGDSNPTVKKAYASAMGHVVRYSKDSSTEKLILRLKGWYFDKADKSLQLSCAWVFSAISSHSSDTFKRHAGAILPVVFVAMHDSSLKSESSAPNAGEIWEEIWSNNTPGTQMGVKLYLNEIFELVQPLLSHPSWEVRAQGAKSIATIAENIGSSLGQPFLGNFLSALLATLPGRTWKGKEAILQALSKVCIMCRSTLVSSELHEGQDPSIQMVLDAMLKECQREALDYKLAALHHCALVVEGWKVDLFEPLQPHVLALIRKSDDAVDEEGDTLKRKNQIDEMRVAGWDAFARLWPENVTTQGKYFAEAVDLFSTDLNRSTWRVQQSILKALENFITRSDWSLACTSWKASGESSCARTFVDAVLPETCSCLENTSYKSVKLQGCKVLRALFAAAQGTGDLLPLLSGYRDRILALATGMISSTDFEVPIHYRELLKIIGDSQNSPPLIGGT